MSLVARLCLDALRFGGEAELRATTIAPASAELVRERAPKRVTAAGTLDFSTLVPAPGGLFDYKVFGPGTVIDAPDIADDAPVSPAASRKTQFGRITLALPVVHPLVVARRAAEVAELAGWTAEQLDAWSRGETDEQHGALADALVERGHGVLALAELPVLPPDLRPLRRLDDDRWASSPINDLYRRVLELNARLTKLVESAATPVAIGSERRHLQRAVLQLFANELTASPLLDAAQAPLMSLVGMCGGAEGMPATLQTIDAHHAAGTAELPGRVYKLTCVLFALGFDVRARASA